MHTPGPWELEGESDHQHQYWSVEATMTGVSRPGRVADSLNRDHVIDPEEDRANGRLIAAAPDLLGACEAMLDSQEVVDVHERVLAEGRAFDQLRAACGRAKGGG